MAKFSPEQRAAYAKTGTAMKNGSYPIRNATDLANAVKDYNRTGQDPAVRAHILKRAAALGLPRPGI